MSQSRAVEPATALRWTPRHVHTPTVRLSLATAGHGPPVLLLPGAGGWHLTFAGLGEALARRHRVIAVDPPGQGTTSITGPDGPFGVDDTVGSLHALLDALELDGVDVVGHSWGGGYAARLAQLHPDRVRRLVLLAPGGIPHRDVWELRLARRRWFGEAVVRWLARPAMRRLVVRSVAHRSHVPRQRLDEALGMISVGPGQHTLRRDLLRVERGVDWTDTASRLADVRARTLVLWGDRDTVLPVRNLERFAVVPHAELVLVEDAGHALPDDQPRIVADRIVEFLDRSGG